MAKLLSPIIGYGTSFELLQFQYDFWLFTALGGAKHGCTGAPLRVALRQRAFSPARVRTSALKRRAAQLAAGS